MTSVPVRGAWPLLLLTACAPPGGVAVGVPWLALPELVEIVDAPPGETTLIGVPVTNEGTASAQVTGAAAPPFAVPGDSVTVPAGETRELLLEFTPTGYDPAEGLLTVSVGSDHWQVPIVASVDLDQDDDGSAAVAAGGDDCDDLDPGRHPGAAEICDGVDQDCDDAVDNVQPPVDWWPDRDLDGHGDPAGPTVPGGCDAPPATAATADDCDDSDPDAFPGAPEVWYDGIDQACDQGSDFDQDADGADIGPLGEDCDDQNAGVGPDVTEVWYDGIDQDCDGNDLDQDRDGSPSAAWGGDDCDDLEPTTFPGAPELDDGLDQDCDGLLDEGLFARGSLVVTEMMLNPDAVSDANGRWFEVWNPTDGHVLLDQVVVTIGSRATALTGVLAPGEIGLLCTNVDPAANGGLTCISGAQWVGFARTLTLAAGGVDLDEVDWNGWALPAGVAWELSASALDPDLNDAAAAWCNAVDPMPSGDLGTPGVIAPPCP